MVSRLWVLGAADPEMAAIERLLIGAGEMVCHATVYRDGVRRRVSASEAYAADVAIDDDVRGLDVHAYAVECRPSVLYGSDVDGIDWGGMVTTIDHHCPGDPGYGRPPAEFLAASSIGQVAVKLAETAKLPPTWRRRSQPLGAGVHLVRRLVSDHHGYTASSDAADWWVGHDGIPCTCGGSPGCTVVSPWRVPEEIVLAAAADHCLAAAYGGECPGVDPDALMRWRVETRAAHQHRSVADVLADIEIAREALRRAPITDGIPGVRDMRCAYTVTTTLVMPFVPGALVDAAGIGDSAHVEFGRGDIGCWDEGSHHTRVSRGVSELPEAACREGMAYIADVAERDGRRKVVIGGRTTADQIRVFADAWAPAQGLTGIYGDPARGFAGGYPDDA